MARPLSENKRKAILAAATSLFAESGLKASPTSEISKRAGVAEGTLFTYFKTKDDLVNALYREIKLEIAAAMMSDFPAESSVQDRLRFLWNGYVDWGVDHSPQRKALAQIQVSEMLTAESIQAGLAPFAPVYRVADDAAEQGIVSQELSFEFIGKIMMALQEATMDLMNANPMQANWYRDLGFEMFWTGLTQTPVSHIQMNA